MFSRFRERSEKSQGFTLIELLIVIAIILILIAIALPNFLEAQLRARVTKAKAEMKSLGVAQEAYFLDWKMYPPEHERDRSNRLQRGLFWLTSPIKYIGSIPEDPFHAFGPDEQFSTYVTYETGGVERGGAIFDGACRDCLVTYVMFSNGPDHVQDIYASEPHYYQGNEVLNYAPTNGSNSNGSLYYWGGDGFWIGVPATSTRVPNARTLPLQPLIVDGKPYAHRLPPY